MNIASITPHFFEFPLAAPIADARNTIRARSCVIVEVRTEDGAVGWGEAASFAGCGALVCHVVRFLAQRLVDRNGDDPEALYREMFGATLHFGRRGLVVNALSGIDVALWDLKGKREGLPLYRLLGAARHDIDFYFNGGYFVERDPHGFLRRSAERAVERGARALKIKIGKSVDDDVRRMDIAREVLGPGRDLMVDANGILDMDYLTRLDPAMSERRIRWMEEPVAIQSVDMLRQVRDSLNTPIAGYELEQTAQGWRALIDGGTVDVAQPDAIWSGGITECVEVAAIAAERKAEFVPHNFATIVCLAANAHLAAHAATGGWLEVDSNDNPFLWPINRLDTFGLADGKIAMPDAPGLGLDIDLASIERYRKAA